MSINLKKICRDISRPEEDVQYLALTTITQMTPSSIEDPSDVLSLRTALHEAAASSNEDIVFLARKAINHLEQLAMKIPGGLPAAPPPPPPAAAGTPAAEPPQGPDRIDVLASIQVEDDPVKLATLVSQMIRIAEPVDLEATIPLLKNRDARVRSNAVEVVERLADGKKTTELLTPLLSDDNNRVRGNVAKALGRIGMPRTAKYLEEMLHSSKVSMRESAVYALSHIRGTQMVDLLVQALRDPYEGIRLRAVRGLKMHNDERSLPHIRPLMNDLDIDVCEEAHKAIRVIRHDQAPTVAGEMYDIEMLAKRDAERRAAAQAAAHAAAQAKASQAAPAEEDLDLDELEATEPATGPMSLKQGADDLQKQAESLLNMTSAVAPIDLSGRSKMELTEMLKSELQRVGQEVFKRVRTNVVQHRKLSLIYYDVLKYQETLRRHQERAESGDSGPKKGFFDSLKDKLGNKPQEEDPVTRLRRRVEEGLMDLGRIALTVSQAGEVDLGDMEGLSRPRAIMKKLDSLPDEE